MTLVKPIALIDNMKNKNKYQPSSRKKKRRKKREKNGENSGPLTLLPVDRQNFSECNAGDFSNYNLSMRWHY